MLFTCSSRDVSASPLRCLECLSESHVLRRLDLQSVVHVLQFGLISGIIVTVMWRLLLHTNDGPIHVPAAMCMGSTLDSAREVQPWQQRLPADGDVHRLQDRER